MEFTSINGVTTSSSLTNGAQTNENELDRHAFLKLFTTQLQNQNPLEPVKNEAFVAQLAQFSALEATSSMSDSLAKFVEDQRSQGLMEGASLIGKKVFVENSTFNQPGGESIEGGLDLYGPADDVVVTVKNVDNGQVINQFHLGSQAAGEISFAWNGGDSKGREAPSGTYIFSASATISGKTNPITTFTQKEVTGVSWDSNNSSAHLDLEDGYVLPLESVRKISS